MIINYVTFIHWYTTFLIHFKISHFLHFYTTIICIQESILHISYDRIVFVRTILKLNRCTLTFIKIQKNFFFSLIPVIIYYTIFNRLSKVARGL